MEPQKILFLYVNCGGGHLSCSKTIAGHLSRRYQHRVECVLVDGIGQSRLAQRLMEDSYQRAHDGSAIFAEAAYALQSLKGIANTSVNMMTTLIKDYLKEVFLKEKPDKVVAVHAMLTRPAEVVLKELGMDVPVIVLVTDPFTVFPLWLTGLEAHYVVFSDVARKVVTKKFSRTKVSQFQYFVNEKYSTPLDKKSIYALKRKFGFDTGKKLILVLGGGEGMPKGKILVKGLVDHFNKSGPDVEFAIVCGRSKVLRDYSRRIARKDPGINIKVYGFVDFVYELVNMSDIVITKAGPATIFEILLSRKILILNFYMWGQEKGNVKFVVKNNLGYYQPDNSKIPSLASDILSDQRLMDRMVRNIRSLDIRNGTPEVSRFVYEYPIAKND